MAGTKSLGVLTLDMIARIGGFKQGMTEAERQSEKTARKIAADQKRAAEQMQKEWDRIGGAIKAGIAGITIGATIRAFIRETVTAQNEQAQLAAVIKSTGQAAGYAQDELNAMAASMAGKSIFREGDITTAQTRLLSYTNVVGEQFPKALQAAIDMASRLNMPLAQSAETIGKALDVPSQGLTVLTKQGFRFTEEQKKLIEKLEDTGRTAEAQKIILDGLNSAYGGAAEAARNTLGGAIAALQNKLKDLTAGDDGSFQGTVDSVNELTRTLNSPEVKNAFATIATAIADLTSKLVTGGAEFIKFGKFVGEALGLAFAGPDDPIDRIDQKLVQLRARLESFSNEKNLKDRFLFGLGTDGLGREIDKIKQEITNLERARAGFLRSAFSGTTTPSVPPKVLPTPDRIAHTDSADDPAKKLLDNFLKSLQRSISEQSELLGQRNRILDFYNSQGLLSVSDYYAQQKNILDEATREQSRAYDEQIAALRQFQAAATKKTEQAEAEGKINELLDKQAKLHRDAGFAAIEMGLKQKQAAEEYKKQVDQINASILELKGNLSAAALIRFDASNERLLRQATAAGDKDTLQRIAELRQYTAAQADLNKLQQQFSLGLGDLQIAEERLAITRQAGAIGELEYLQKLGGERQQAAAYLRTQLALYEQIAEAIRTPEQQQAIERLKLQLESLSATLDPLKDKIDTVFKDSFSDAFADFVTGTKSASEAFRAFTDTVFRELTRLATQQIAADLFGGSGGGNFGSLLGRIFSALPSFDVGTPYVPQDMIAKVHKGERILTAEENKSFGEAMSVTNNFYLNEPASRQSQQQVATAASMAIERARRRNG